MTLRNSRPAPRLDLRLAALPLAILSLAPATAAQEPAAAAPRAVSFTDATTSAEAKLEASLAELERVTAAIAAEKLPLRRELSRLETELDGVRSRAQQASRSLTLSSLDLSNLRDEIKQRRDTATYVSGMLADYARNLEARLHIAELPRYETLLEEARLATENGSMDEGEVFAKQLAVVAESIERLHRAAGGEVFEGSAVDEAGLVTDGKIALVGPVAVFRSADGRTVGSAEQRLGSLQAAAIPFADPEDRAAADRSVAGGAGELPVDATLGNAVKIEATQETLWEHVQKGGPVMIPIFALAALALLVALYKWISLALIPRPSRKEVNALLGAVARRDQKTAEAKVQGMRGPLGRMLAVGVEHLREPRELIEEAMYETVLTARLRTQKMLSFIGVCAASAPLLGLLGTVTGIINTFKLITVFGSGDVKYLSGGISEALITTKFGLIVAIPSLLIHAYLTRKARAVVGNMEATAVSFVNQVGTAPPPTYQNGAAKGGQHAPAATATVDRDQLRDQIRDQIREVIGEFLGPVAKQRSEQELIRKEQPHAG